MLAPAAGDQSSCDVGTTLAGRGEDREIDDDGFCLRNARMTALQLNYTVHFLCPAFLGNSEQSGQWRTPPFKALLRQWWRVAYAADHRFSVDVDRMREDEGRLFGAAADAGDSNRSCVRIRLDRWDRGSMGSWQTLGNVNHPEVGQVDGGLYLGYGPLRSR